MRAAVGLLTLLTIDPAPVLADKADKAAPPAIAPGPPKPGPETKALAPFIGNFNYTGQVRANAMGPGSPEMPSHGKHKCHLILGDLWAACDIEDIAGVGKSAGKWSGHLLLGWDFEAKAYRAVLVDNFGASGVMAGKLDGSKLTLETIGEATFLGQPIKYRISYDATDPKSLKFAEERSVKNGPFLLAEEGILKKQ